MFDQILQLVKEHIGANPQVSSAIPADKADAVHQEIAAHITIKDCKIRQQQKGALIRPALSAPYSLPLSKGDLRSQAV